MYWQSAVLKGLPCHRIEMVCSTLFPRVNLEGSASFPCSLAHASVRRVDLCGSSLLLYVFARSLFYILLFR